MNKEVAQILRGYGLEPNKTHTLKFPIIPDEFMPDFLRGFWMEMVQLVSMNIKIKIHMVTSMQYRMLVLPLISLKRLRNQLRI